MSLPAAFVLAADNVELLPFPIRTFDAWYKDVALSAGMRGFLRLRHPVFRARALLAGR